MWVIKVHGFTDTAMEKLVPSLASQPGYHIVTPTKRAGEIGEWKILVNKEKMNEYYSWLATNLSDITAQFPSNLRSPDNYPPHEITSRNPHIYYEQEDDATNAASFGTMLTNSMEEMAPSLNENDFQPINLFTTDFDSTHTTARETIPGDQHPTNPDTQQATYAEIAGNKQGRRHTNRKKYKYGNATIQQNQWVNRGGYIQAPNETNRYADEHTENATEPNRQSKKTPPTEVDVSSMSEPSEHPLAKLAEEFRVANAAQAHQIATMQAEMNFLREGMMVLLQQKAQKESEVTILETANPHGPPSSNKRQNTMSTPTKPRQDSLQNCPDVDFDCQPMENND